MKYKILPKCKVQKGKFFCNFSFKAFRVLTDLTFARLHELSKTKTSFCVSRYAKLTSEFPFLFVYWGVTKIIIP